MLEDLERILTPHADSQVTLQQLAEKLAHWEEAERQAHSAADVLEEAGADSGVPLLHLDGLDDLLEITVKRATAIRATTMIDLGHKGRILQVMTRTTRWGLFELTEWGEAFIASVAADAVAMQEVA